MSGAWDYGNKHRAYYMIHNALYDMADKYFESIEKNVKSKGGREVLSEDKYKVSGRREWMGNFQFYFPIWFAKGRPKWTSVMAEQWFRDNNEILINKFFLDWGYKNIADAIENTSSFNRLCKNWDIFFEEMRRRFMVKCKNEVAKTGKQIKASSHGGVANLLKTLTKTMELQNASIQSIAKVQYTVCMQAGIYIPDEFITDVSTAVYELNVGGR